MSLKGVVSCSLSDDVRLGFIFFDDFLTFLLAESNDSPSRTTAKNNRKPLVRSGTSFEWKIDCYDGCEHGCRYCYAWWIKRQKHAYYSSWTKPTPVQNVVSDLQSQLSGMRNTTKANIKDIFVSSLTDCYQPLELQQGITREVIETLIEHELPFTVLTKNSNVLRDKDVFKDYDKCRVGFTIVTLDDNLRQSLELGSRKI